MRRDAFEVPEQMRDAAPALGVDPYTWVLAGGDDHALAATFPAGGGAAAGLAGRSAGCIDGAGVTVDGAAVHRTGPPAGTTSAERDRRPDGGGIRIGHP